MKSFGKRISLFVVTLLLVFSFAIPANTVKAAPTLENVIILDDVAFTMDALASAKPGDKVYTDIMTKLGQSGTNPIYFNLSGIGWADLLTGNQVTVDVACKGLSTINVEDENGNITPCTVPATTDDLVVTGIE